MSTLDHPLPATRDGIATPRIAPWTRVGAAPSSATSVHVVEIAPELERALGALAAACDLDLGTLLLAAHAKVLGAVTSERSVVTACRSGDGSGLCRIVIGDGSWRELLAVTAAARGKSAHEPGVAAESALDLTGLDAAPPPTAHPEGATIASASDTTALGAPPSTADPAGAAVLAVAARRAHDELELVLRCRTDVIDEDFAVRLAGYHLAALRLMSTDPEARHGLQSLLSDAELHTLLHDRAGRREPLPDGLFVELFEERARLFPDDRAALHREHGWTYRELNEHANAIAHLLLAEGLAAEDVVAVVMSRHLDWLAAMLGVLKAGGVYLPVRPDFPPDRVATQLRRSACRVALTDDDGSACLRAALEGMSWHCAELPVAGAREHAADVGNPGVRIEPGQLAYIYFTSGSTGTPKGAMCEHAGMLNHLLAKIEDMRLRPGDVVTQTASQCFDISLWQLAAPLLVTGCTRIVDTEDQLDVDRFVEQICTGDVHVVQIVPTYLDVLLTQLERDWRPLGNLRSVSVTGEALKLELVRRWFALYPDIALVNAYGATEVCDDTMHEVLDAPPQRDFVAVGRSLRNVDTYVLDEHLRLVPLGAPGEIAFSGVCVGRGYVNDPERTAQAFTDDPYRPGTRMYRTGDFGRWLPEGTIEFLGRRDEQIKIRGFRIEIGEIENTLLRMPGIQDATAVTLARDGGDRKLVAFFTGDDALQPAHIRDFLADSLPEYMVPASFLRLEVLPVTENGKVDKRALAEVAAEIGERAADYVPPATDTERRLATAWAETLNVLVGRISRADDFFALGGTSLAAVRLVVRLDRAMSLRELVATPVLADLAELVDSRRSGSGRARAAGKLLSRLSALDPAEAAATMICFPYASGNAVNFQQLALELERDGIAVLGVELPGHDVARPDEPLARVSDVARRARREIGDLASRPLLLWGQCAGGVHALQLARLLEHESLDPAHVFLGAVLLDDPLRLRREIDEISALSNREITAQLHSSSAYVELDLLKAERAELVGAAYRHDVCSTNRALIAMQRDEVGRRLRAPVELVVAADDPTTSGFRQRWHDWRRLAHEVTLHELADGGHYFTKTRPAETARIVVECGALADAPSPEG